MKKGVDHRDEPGEDDCEQTLRYPAIGLGNRTAAGLPSQAGALE
jgi:hypothetical protein